MQDLVSAGRWAEPNPVPPHNPARGSVQPLLGEITHAAAQRKLGGITEAPAVIDALMSTLDQQFWPDKEDVMARTQTVEEKTGAPRSNPFEDRSIREHLLGELPVVERRLQLAGISTAVLEGGEGPPVVLLHGPGEHAAKWMLVIPSLVKTHRVIAPDLPAHGSSAVTGGPLTAERVIDWLAELIDSTCDSPPVLCGQIIGGAIAARFAIRHSDHISTLVLADALGLAPFQPTPEFGQALMGFLSQPNEETHDRLWQRCAFDLDSLRSRLGDRWTWLRAYNLDRAQTADLGAHQQRLMESFGIPEIPVEDLQRIAVPTTLIWGRHDLATPLRVAEAASAHHGWPLLVIENAADDPALEQPGAFVDALRRAAGKF